MIFIRGKYQNTVFAPDVQEFRRQVIYREYISIQRQMAQRHHRRIFNELREYVGMPALPF